MSGFAQRRSGIKRVELRPIPQRALTTTRHVRTGALNTFEERLSESTGRERACDLEGAGGATAGVPLLTICGDDPLVLGGAMSR